MFLIPVYLYACISSVSIPLSLSTCSRLMDKKYYETALVLAAGVVLGQVVAILLEMAFSIWSFVPIALAILLLGFLSLRRIADAKGLINASVKTRIATGVWTFLVWELFRRRFIWIVDVAKFIILFAVLYILYRILRRRWEE